MRSIEDVTTKLFTGSYALSPRGAKRAFKATEDKHFMDERSFVSLDGHEYLYGHDKEDRRWEIYQRALGNCELKLSPDCAGRVSFPYGEWCHIEHGANKERCDCMHNSQWGCTACHRMQHADRNPQFSNRNGGPSSDLDSDN